MNSRDIKRDASFVFRADLKPGRSGEDAVELVRSWFRLDGVAGTEGDAGEHVWVYGDADATVTEMNALRSRIESDDRVSRLVQER